MWDMASWPVSEYFRSTMFVGSSFGYPSNEARFGKCMERKLGLALGGPRRRGNLEVPALAEGVSGLSGGSVGGLAAARGLLAVAMASARRVGSRRMVLERLRVWHIDQQYKSFQND